MLFDLLMMPFILLFFLFQIKHLVVDFFLQGPYMYLNKGTFGHPGGLLHAGLHGVVSLIMLVWLFGVHHQSALLWLATICVAEFVIHYLVDWAKMNLNRIRGWGPNTSEWFWYSLGVDQFLHQITYLGMIVAVLLVDIP